MKMTLTQAMARIAELEKQVITLTPKKKGKARADWAEPNMLDEVASLTDDREWRNSSWNGGTPPGPWECKVREIAEALGKEIKIIANKGRSSLYKGQTRGVREQAAKDTYERLTLTRAIPNKTPREVGDM